MEKFKKGDKGYVLVNSVIVPCEIIKLSNESHLRDWGLKKISKKSLYKPLVDPQSEKEVYVGGTWPNKVAWIAYLLDYGEKKEATEWIEVDLIKKSPSDFINFIN